MEMVEQVEVLVVLPVEGVVEQVQLAVLLELPLIVVLVLVIRSPLQVPVLHLVLVGQELLVYQIP